MVDSITKEMELRASKAISSISHLQVTLQASLPGL